MFLRYIYVFKSLCSFLARLISPRVPLSVLSLILTGSQRQTTAAPKRSHMFSLSSSMERYEREGSRSEEKKEDRY